MRAFLVLAPNGKCHLLTFPTDFEAEAVPDALRKGGTRILPAYWS